MDTPLLLTLIATMENADKAMNLNSTIISVLPKGLIGPNVPLSSAKLTQQLTQYPLVQIF